MTKDRLDRFRFRAWDKKNKRMLYKIQEAYDGGCVEDEKGNDVDNCYVDCFSSFFPYDDNDKNEEFIVEQCTGLKDKNGRLIYENDVVSCGFPDIGCVKWKNGGFWVSGVNYIMPWHFFIANKWEVLGNIHENPELLEDK